MPRQTRPRPTPVGVTNDPLFDGDTIDRADERTVQLHRILIQAYDDEYEALAIAGQVGLLKADIERHPKLSLTWWSIMEEAKREARLRDLLDMMLKDPTIASWKPQLNEVVAQSPVVQKPPKPVAKASTAEEQRAASSRPEVGDVARLWDVESELTVGFYKGPAKIKGWIEEAAMQWVEYANLKLVFTDVSKATIRVGFDQGMGSWAYLGTDARLVPPAMPTCNFGWFGDTTPRTDVFPTVLHEFGHVLGLQHEHGNPASTFKWDKSTVYKEFAGPPNHWDRATVDWMIFSIWPPKYFPVHKVFDRDSIMMFSLPRHFFLDDNFTPENKTLSDLDRQFIAALYPLRTRQDRK
jgi:serralysin